MINVQNYQDYKTYLKDIYKAKSAKHTRFSFAVWAKSLGISSPSLLSMVINGNRHPSKKLAEKLSDYLSHTEQERTYFRGLIDLRKASVNPNLSVQLNSSLLNIDPNVIQLEVQKDKEEEAIKLLEEFKAKMKALVASDASRLEELSISVNEISASSNEAQISIQ